VVQRWGGVDILVNNAAIFDMAPIVEVTEASYDKVFAVNVKGLFFTLQAVARRMIERGRGGKIINMASQAGRRGEALVSIYCASKAAVISLTQSAGLDLIKHRINVNGIAPGVVDTPMWAEVDALFAKYEHRPIGEKKRLVGEAVPFGRMGLPNDHVGAAVFLASSESDFVVAQTLNVDGGNWMSLQRRGGFGPMYLDRFKLKGRVALVTGGAQGIGLACVEALSEAGAYVYIADRNLKIAREARAAMKVKGYAGDVIEMEVTDSKQADAAAARVMAEKGRVDILVCNAGIARSQTPAEDVTDEHWLNVIDVNLNGLFWCCRAFGKTMLAAGRGSIINIGSMSGFIVNKPQQQAYYNASKAAVHHLTKSLAAEWGARGVRVNAVAPTYINTPLTAHAKTNEAMMGVWIDGTPMARMGEPDEIAAVVLFLASDASSLLTGSIVLADGGYTCW
jgi:NAD(P)-dependent dehydrogenase (short-subunit alcohol dehydrogenase family)